MLLNWLFYFDFQTKSCWNALKNRLWCRRKNRNLSEKASCRDHWMMKSSYRKPNRHMDHHQLSSMHDQRLNCLRYQCVSPLQSKRSAPLAIKIAQTETNNRVSVLRAASRCYAYASAPNPSPGMFAEREIVQEKTRMRLNVSVLRLGTAALHSIKKVSLLYEYGHSELA